MRHIIWFVQYVIYQCVYKYVSAMARVDVHLGLSVDVFIIMMLLKFMNGSKCVFNISHQYSKLFFISIFFFFCFGFFSLFPSTRLTFFGICHKRVFMCVFVLWVNEMLTFFSRKLKRPTGIICQTKYAWWAKLNHIMCIYLLYVDRCANLLNFHFKSNIYCKIGPSKANVYPKFYLNIVFR